MESMQSRKAMSALIKKEAQLSRPLAPKKNGKHNENEPVEKKAKYSINMEGKSMSQKSINQTLFRTDLVFAASTAVNRSRGTTDRAGKDTTDGQIRVGQ